MRTKQNPETQEQQDERLEKAAQNRRDKAAADDKVIDDMVKQSIRRWGP